jgi:hypothetical protein
MEKYNKYLTYPKRGANKSISLSDHNDDEDNN